MKEIDPVDFYEKVVDDENGASAENERVLELASGEALTVQVQAVERDWLFDQLDRLPDEIMEVLAGADDVDEAERQAMEEDMLSNVDGETVRTFETICLSGLHHPQLTDDHWKPMVKELDLQVLFPIGAEIMELTLGEGGSITDFHEPDSAKSSS